MILRTYTKVKSQKVALDIQSQILKSANGGGDPLESVFLKPTKNTDYAIKFIEKYLLTKDATAQGVTFGSTDELGFAAAENKVTVPDWHATILHQLGLHHESLFFERNGLKERLTGVTGARVIREVLS